MDAPSNFLRAIIEADLESGRHTTVVTRFPPEPNGYLHIGHAKAICVDFGMAADYGGRCHLRFDDTNPETEDTEYVQGIQADVKWLGFDWGEHLYFASDFFEEMYQLAVGLVRDGKAYVDSSTDEEIREHRGSVSEPGRPTPSRSRSIEENLDLFARMRAGEFPDGAHVLRAKGDLSHPNMKLRDPLLYRIRHAKHHRTGDAWCIYPMYDYAHPLEDALEHVTHSICTLEFENNRAIYDWVIEHCDVPAEPRQYEMARLAVEYTITSKRKLRLLVESGRVDGWDDPRMPTIAGIRRRGVRAEAVRAFIHSVGVAKANSTVPYETFEAAIRDDLNPEAPRVMAVLDPLEVVITNFDEGRVEQLAADYWPHDIPREGTRQVPFTRTLYIERADFQEQPVKGFKRLAPGREVRLRYAYFITCNHVEHDAQGRVIRLHCSYDPATHGGSAPDGRKVKGTLHWVSATEGVRARVNLYDRLFRVPDPAAAEDFLGALNPTSLTTIQAVVEPSLASAAPGSRFQFERTGYFYVEPESSTERKPVFNRIVTLKDTWSRKAKPAPTPKAAAPKADRPSAAPTPAAPSELPAPVLAFLDAAASGPASRESAEKWLRNELMGHLKDRDIGDLPFGGKALGELVHLVDTGAISGTTGKKVLEILVDEGGDPSAIVSERGWGVVSDADMLAGLVDELIAAHPDEVGRFREGNQRMLGFFVGQVMKRTQGRADGQLVNTLVRQRLQA